MFDPTKYLKKDALVDLTCDMIKIPSDFDSGETKLAHFIKKFFEKNNIETKTNIVSDNRENVIALLKSDNSKKPLLLCGHLDTVPCYDFEDGFSPKIDGTKLFGRGAVDMKGQVACMMEAMRIIKEMNISLTRDVIFAGVIDEEEHSYGAINLAETGIEADFCIIGEATDFKICTCHKGLEWLKFTFSGKAVHSGSYHMGISAIEMASFFIQKCEENIRPKLNEKIHHLVGKGILNYGKIEGGTQPSTVAGSCTLEVDRRWLPDETYEEILQEFENIVLEVKNKFNSDVKMEIVPSSIMKKDFFHLPLNMDMNNPAIEIVKNSLISAEKNVEISGFPAWTDAGIIHNYCNIPTIILGPGDVSCAHTKNEHIKIDDLYHGALVYTYFILNYCT